MEKKRTEFNKMLHNAYNVLTDKKYQSIGNPVRLKVKRHYGGVIIFRVEDALITLREMQNIEEQTCGRISFYGGTLNLTFDTYQYYYWIKKQGKA